MSDESTHSRKTGTYLESCNGLSLCHVLKGNFVHLENNVSSAKPRLVRGAARVGLCRGEIRRAPRK